MHQPRDAYIVLKTGDAFRKVSDSFCQRMSALPLEESKQEADKDKGGMIAAATCLAFAVELYIKALRMLNRLGPKRIHYLDELYSDLPNNLRRSIEKRYNAGMGTSSRALVVNITHKDATSQERMKKPQPEVDQSLLGVLKRSRDVFTTWRYLYDQGEPAKVQRANSVWTL
jgi:hypothetical protein